MNIIAKHLTRICPFYSLRGTLVFVGIVFSQLLYAQRVTTTNEKGTKFTTGNTVTESATAPTTPAPIQGDIWLDTTAKLTKVWDGTTWRVFEVGLDLRFLGNGNHLTVDAGVGSNGTSLGTGDDNIAIGEGTLSAVTTAFGNVAIGTSSMQNNIDGEENVAIGYQALFSNTLGHWNVALGNTSLMDNIDGDYNVAVGNNSLGNHTSGHENTAVGDWALGQNTTGQFNTALGGSALVFHRTGSYNTGVGYQSGGGLTTGSNNTLLGSRISGLAPALSNNIILADGEGNQRIRVLANGDVGIDITTPTEQLDVNGRARIRMLDAGNTATDEVVVADATGVLKKVSVGAITQEPWYTAGTTTGHTTNTGDMFFSGNIGVATNTLSAGKVATFAGDVDIQGVLDPTKLIFSGDGSIGSFNPTTNNQYEIEFQEGRDLEIKSNTTANIMHIESGGNVGVGTALPTYKLEVAGANSDALINSVRVGKGAGDINSNTAVGQDALSSNTTAEQNTAIGYRALASNNSSTPGESGANVAVGANALFASTTGNNNTAIGTNNLAANISGNHNVAIGGHSSLNSSTGGQNTAVGAFSYANNTTGSLNTALGYGALGNNLTGNKNIAVGVWAGLGAGSSAPPYTASENSIFIGTYTTPQADNQTNQTVIGYEAQGIGSNTVVLGNDAVVTTALKGNVGIGTTTPTYKLEVSGANSDALINSVRVGRGAGDIISNTTLGAEALNSNTSGLRNTAVGRAALKAVTTGNDNIGFGSGALQLNEEGNSNIGIGTSALANSTLHSNIGIGTFTLTANATGQRNLAIGYGALQFMTLGNDNVALGYLTGRSIVGGGANEDPNNSIFIGRDAKALAANQTNQIVIGYNANGIGSNSVVLGNDAIVTTALKGNVGIGTVLPTDKLDVNGRVRVRTLDTGDTSTDNVVLVNADGVFKKVPVAAVGTPEPWFGVDDNAPATSNTEDMYVMGNVGIGTATPAYKLEVAGANSDALINGVRVGKGAGDVDTNTAVGANTLMNNTTDGTRNTAVGYQALMNITTGDNNVAMGYNALNQIVGGHENVAIGNRAMENNISGGANVAMGYFALMDNTSGIRNTAIGGLALQRNTIGNDNIAIGTTAGAKIINGGIDNTVAYQSIYIGNGTEPQLSNQTNQIIIGYQAEGIGSNTVVLGNDAVVTTALKGNVGIGNTSPNASAILDLSNTASKVLLLPTVAPGTVSGATDGMITFDSSNNNAYLRANGAWKPLSYNTVTNELIFNGEDEGSGTYDDYYYVSLVQNGNWKVVRYHKTNPNDEATANSSNNSGVTVQPTTVSACVSLTF